MRTPTATSFVPATDHAAPRRGRATKASVALWALQVPLAALFLFAGGTKLLTPVAALEAQAKLPGAFLQFIGILETLGGLGLVLPGLLRLRAELVPLAAAGLIVVMSGAVGAMLAAGQGAGAWVPVLVGGLAAVVLWGRWRVAPHGV